VVRLSVKVGRRLREYGLHGRTVQLEMVLGDSSMAAASCRVLGVESSGGRAATFGSWTFGAPASIGGSLGSWTFSAPGPGGGFSTSDSFGGSCGFGTAATTVFGVGMAGCGGRYPVAARTTINSHAPVTTA